VSKRPPLPSFPEKRDRERAPEPTRYRVCEVCGQTYDIRNLDQVFHHDPTILYRRHRSLVRLERAPRLDKQRLGAGGLCGGCSNGLRRFSFNTGNQRLLSPCALVWSKAPSRLFLPQLGLFRCWLEDAAVARIRVADILAFGGYRKCSPAPASAGVSGARATFRNAKVCRSKPLGPRLRTMSWAIAKSESSPRQDPAFCGLLT
jgi:hypothetical protein